MAIKCKQQEGCAEITGCCPNSTDHSKKAGGLYNYMSYNFKNRYCGSTNVTGPLNPTQSVTTGRCGLEEQVWSCWKNCVTVDRDGF